MMNHFNMSPAEGQELFKLYNLGPDDFVLVNYDITIDVGPHSKSGK